MIAVLIQCHRKTTAVSSVEEARPQKMTGYDTVYQAPEGRQA